MTQGSKIKKCRDKMYAIVSVDNWNIVSVEEVYDEFNDAKEDYNEIMRLSNRPSAWYLYEGTYIKHDVEDMQDYGTISDIIDDYNEDWEESGVYAYNAKVNERYKDKNGNALADVSFDCIDISLKKEVN